MNTEKNEPKVNLGIEPDEEIERESNEKESSSTEKQANFAETIKNLKNEQLILLAENQNLRRRHEKEKESAIKFAAGSALSQLVSPFETLCSSLKVEVPDELKDNEFVKSMMEGQMLIQKEFEKTFEKIGLKRIYPLGEKLDSDYHDAVSQFFDETKEIGTILHVISAGFILNGRVIQHAKVVINGVK